MSGCVGIPGAKLTAKQRTDLLETLADLIQRKKSDTDTIYGLQHPSSDDTTSGASPTSADDPDAVANLQLKLDQANRQLAVQTRSALLSDAELKAFSSSGDIGAGAYGSALDAGRAAILTVLGDSRSLLTLAGAVNQGNGMQPAVAANKSVVRI